MTLTSVAAPSKLILNQQSSNPVPTTKTWIDVLSHQAQQRPHGTAQTFLLDGENNAVHLSFAELDLQTRTIAAVLQQSVVAGERALLLYPPGLAFTCAFMACLFTNVVAVPVYPPRRGKMDKRLLGIINNAEPSVILTTEKIRSELQIHAAATIQAGNMQLIASDQIPAIMAAEWQRPYVDPDALAFLQYTSGSTGQPKGVMVTHGNLLHNADLIQRVFQLPKDENTAFWLPEYHDMGLIGGILQPLYWGVCSIRMSPIDFLHKPIRWLQMISRYRVATSGAPNFAYELCADRITPEQCENLDLSDWTLAFSGAEPVRADTLEKFIKKFAPYGFHAEAFSPCYGMAEATLLISGVERNQGCKTLQVDEAALAKHQVIPANHDQDPATKLRTLTSCGQIGLDQEVLIVDPESLQPCGHGQVGEIWLQGFSVAQGYWNQPALSQQTFAAQIATSDDTVECLGQPCQGYLRTGDLGFVHTGELYITGRLKDVIIIRGRNHYPQDIELSVEQSHPDLRPGCGAAFTVDIGTEEQLIIVHEVERQKLRSVNIDEVSNAIRRAVAEQHSIQVATVVLLRTTTIAKTSSGKIRRYACRQAYLNNTLNVVGIWQAPTIA